MSEDSRFVKKSLLVLIVSNLLHMMLDFILDIVSETFTFSRSFQFTMAVAVLLFGGYCLYVNNYIFYVAFAIASGTMMVSHAFTPYKPANQSFSIVTFVLGVFNVHLIKNFAFIPSFWS